MKLTGSAALGVWHSVQEGYEAEINRWYIKEHYHDRVVIDGFLRARSYRNIDPDGPMYFSRYDTETVDTMSCEQYMHSLSNPSSWSQKVFPNYRNTVRGTFSVSSRWTIGTGGYLLSCRMHDNNFKITENLHKELNKCVHDLQNIDGVVAVESWIVNVETTTIRTHEKKIRGEQDVYPVAALLVDLMTPEAAKAVKDFLPHGSEVDLMKLTYQLTKNELILPRSH